MPNSSLIFGTALGFLIDVQNRFSSGSGKTLPIEVTVFQISISEINQFVLYCHNVVFPIIDCHDHRYENSPLPLSWNST